MIFPWKICLTSIAQKNQALLKLFSTVDKDIARFQKVTGLTCRNACSHCCENAAIETTTLELLPLVTHLYNKKTITEWLSCVEDAGRKGRCIFYNPELALQGDGGCSVYPFRPLICRLFGFSATLNKRNQPMLVTCPIIKQSSSKVVEKIQGDTACYRHVPVMNHYVRRLFSIDPALGVEQIPINEAIYRAIQKVGLAREGFKKISAQQAD
jgi:uncharacterized protein